MKKIKWLVISSMALLTLGACATNNEKKETTDKDLKEVTLILDYLPNTNHTGIYVAKEKGYYKEKGIDLTIIEPGQDSTSLALLGANKGEFALSYQEDLTYSAASKDPIPVKAIATVLEHNTSGFASLKEANITTPKDFEGKTYAGWQSASEEATLKAVMLNDKADVSKLKMVGNPAVGASDLGKNIDIKWFYEGWDYTKALMDGYELNFMPLTSLDSRLDYYTPIILTTDQLIDTDPELIQDFVDATKKGYEFAIAEPDKGADILFESAPDHDLEFLKKSQEFVSKHYATTPSKWGVMTDDVWNNYTEFMFDNELITEKIPASTLYTNQFITKDE